MSILSHIHIHILIYDGGLYPLRIFGETVDMFGLMLHKYAVARQLLRGRRDQPKMNWPIEINRHWEYLSAKLNDLFNGDMQQQVLFFSLYTSVQ